MIKRENQVQNSKPAARLKHLLTYGNLWLYILSLIKEHKEVYAYTLGDMVEQEFFFKPNRIMLYIVIYKLEDEGIIKAKQKNKERRKYYEITKKGNEILNFAKDYLIMLGKRL